MQAKTEINVGLRLGSGLLDLVVMPLICGLFFLPESDQESKNIITITHEQGASLNMSSPYLYLGILGIALFFLKDSWHGRSLGKRLTKLQVVDNTTGQPASPLRCVVRNMFCILWPVEAIFILTEPGQRLGDRVARTKVIPYTPSTDEQPRIAYAELIAAIILSYVLVWSVLMCVRALIPNETNADYVKTSYNATESKALEKVYSDSLGKYLSASVQVYDTIKNSQLKYISVIFKLKNNYLEDDNQSNELRKTTLDYLQTLFPENTYTGKMQYVYRGSGTMSFSKNTIGVEIKNEPKK